MKYKKWSLEESRNLISFRRIRNCETCRKYSVSTGTLYSWKKKHEKQGEAGLKVTYDVSKELKQAEEENRILRKLLATKLN
jgi:transposase-like protein